jgi:hypothetical protein
MTIESDTNRLKEFLHEKLPKERNRSILHIFQVRHACYTHANDYEIKDEYVLLLSLLNNISASCPFILHYPQYMSQGDPRLNNPGMGSFITVMTC